jgi:hypothetical protein
MERPAKLKTPGLVELDHESTKLSVNRLLAE